MKKKKKAGPVYAEIVILDQNRAPLFEGSLGGMAFQEELIIAKSAFFFHDPEPCFIHRSAVASRLVQELDLLLQKNPELSIEELNQTYPGYAGGYPGAAIIRVTRAAPQ